MRSPGALYALLVRLRALLVRLREPSTWAGVGVLAGLAGVHLSEPELGAIAAMIGGLVACFLPEGQA